MTPISTVIPVGNEFMASFECVFHLGEEIKDDEPSDKKTGSNLCGFIMSKWETVDPDQIEAQAMTTSKWDMLESSADVSQSSSQNDNNDLNDYNDGR